MRAPPRRPFPEDKTHKRGIRPGSPPERVYHAARRSVTDAPVKVASLLAVRVPSGDPRDFTGIGDTTVAPTLIVSRAVRGHDLHASAGIEMDANGLQRTRARYAAGVTLHPGRASPASST